VSLERKRVSQVQLVHGEKKDCHFLMTCCSKKKREKKKGRKGSAICSLLEEKTDKWTHCQGRKGGGQNVYFSLLERKKRERRRSGTLIPADNERRA